MPRSHQSVPPGAFSHGPANHRPSSPPPSSAGASRGAKIADIRETVELFPNDSRNELSKTICENLNWTTPKGDYRVAAGLRLLEHLEECGILTPSGEARHGGEVGAQADRPRAGLRIRSPRSPAVSRPWSPCRWRRRNRPRMSPCGRRSSTATTISDARGPSGRPSAGSSATAAGGTSPVLLFEAAARTLPARDEWIGWSAADRDRRLHLAVSNSRFLVMPWVRVDNLASEALSMALRQLSGRWEERHACRPVLCETFVDPTRFDGACYRAAGWQRIGMTAGKRSGRGAKPAKEILVRALDPEFRRILKGEAKPKPKPKRRGKSPASASDGRFVAT